MKLESYKRAQEIEATIRKIRENISNIERSIAFTKRNEESKGPIHMVQVRTNNHDWARVKLSYNEIMNGLNLMLMTAKSDMEKMEEEFEKL